MVFVSFSVVPQDVQDQALPRQEAETEQADPPVDQNEDRQQDQVSPQHWCFSALRIIRNVAYVLSSLVHRVITYM